MLTRSVLSDHYHRTLAIIGRGATESDHKALAQRKHNAPKTFCGGFAAILVNAPFFIGHGQLTVTTKISFQGRLRCLDKLVMSWPHLPRVETLKTPPVLHTQQKICELGWSLIPRIIETKFVT